MKTLIIGAAILVGGLGLMSWGRINQAIATEKTNNSKSSLVAPEILYDLGTISMKNGPVSKEFAINNPTGDDITVRTVVTSCMCTAAFIVRADGKLKGPFGMPGMGFLPPANEVIRAGESRTIRVVYDPNAHGPAGVGQIDRFVELTDSSGGALQLEIKALVTQ